MPDFHTLNPEQERAERGANYLDGHYPGWYNYVNLNTLDVQSFDDCPLAQASGYNFAVEYVNLPLENRDEFCRENGFDLKDSDDRFELNRAWFSQVGKRRVKERIDNEGD